MFYQDDDHTRQNHGSIKNSKSKLENLTVIDIVDKTAVNQNEELTWFDTGHAACPVAEALLLLALAVLVRRALAKALLALKHTSRS